MYMPYNIKNVFLFCVAFREFRLSSRFIVFPAFVDNCIKNSPFQRFISTGMVCLGYVWACLKAEVIVVLKYQ